MKKITVLLKEVNGIIGELKVPINTLYGVTYIDLSSNPPLLLEAIHDSPKTMKNIVKRFNQNKKHEKLKLITKPNMALGIITIQRDEDGEIEITTAPREWKP